MRRRNCRGTSYVEMAFIVMALVPLLLGTGVVGINMIKTLQTIQLARDAGHMYAKGLDFSATGNKNVLIQIGSPMGLASTSAASTATVILSSLTYIDKSACAALSLVDASGNPTSACTNYQKWVFTQRLVIGSTTLQSSTLGSPVTTTGTTGAVTVNSTTGKITQSDYTTKSGAQAYFNTINPYANVNNNVSGLPSGQVLFVSEAAGTGFTMPPFVSNPTTYSFDLF